MFARVTHVQAKPEMLQEVVALFQDSVTPLLKQQQGFESSLLLTDPSTGKGMSITVWDTEAHRQAADANGFLREQIVKVMPMLAAPPVPESYVAVRPGENCE